MPHAFPNRTFGARRTVGPLALAAAAFLPGPAPAAPNTPAAPRAQAPAPADLGPVLSTGADLPLLRHLAPDQPTLFLFLRPASGMERRFAADLRRELAGRAGLRIIHLTTGDEPIARRYEIRETPTALLYDRRGRLVVRTGDPEELRAGLRRALAVTRLDWAADDDPRMARIEQLLGRPVRGGILRTMSLQPEYLALVQTLAQKSHFSHGFLDRRTKEMIATYVSALNRCRY